MLVTVLYTNNVNKATDEVRLGLIQKHGSSFVQIMSPVGYISNQDINREFIIVQVPQEELANVSYSGFIDRAGPNVRELMFVIYRPYSLAESYSYVNDFTILGSHGDGIRIPKSNWDVKFYEEKELDMEEVDNAWPTSYSTLLGESVPEWITEEQVEEIEGLYWVIQNVLDERQFPARDLDFRFMTDNKSGYIALFVIEGDFVVKIRPDLTITYAYKVGQESNVITGLTINQLGKVMV